MFGMPVILSLC